MNDLKFIMYSYIEPFFFKMYQYITLNNYRLSHNQEENCPKKTCFLKGAILKFRAKFSACVMTLHTGYKNKELWVDGSLPSLVAALDAFPGEIQKFSRYNY